MTKNPQKKTPEYREGPKAKQAFDATMKALFQIPKVHSKKKGKD